MLIFGGFRARKKADKKTKRKERALFYEETREREKNKREICGVPQKQRGKPLDIIGEDGLRT
jgi:hypothetical protein